MTKPKTKNKKIRPGRAYSLRRRRVPICAQINAIGKAMRQEIAEHVKTCKKCQTRALENMTNNMIEMAVFACD